MQPLMPEVTVNGVAIPAARISAEAQMHPAPKGKPGLAWRAAARALALREVLLQEARALALRPDPQETAPGVIETEDEALIRQVLEQGVTPDPVAPDALRAVYDADPGRFRAPPLWEVAHILFAAPQSDAAARAAARAAADATLARLVARPGVWDDAVAQSACPSRASGGRLGQIGPGDTVAPFESALRGMAEGDIAGPVETRFGFHLIRLDAVAHGAVLPFVTVEPRLRMAAEKAAWVRASRSYAVALLARAQVCGIGQDGAFAAAPADMRP